MSLEAKQRSFLKALGHPMEPIVRVGRSRVTPPVVEETRRSLDAHELIKIRLELDDGDERKALAASLATETGAELVGTIGKVALLYKAHPDKPKIRLP
ncbi:MAG TPA: YhbY family RNA-binding protein [Thermoanaerobaculia bacterium]|nr:YhbY family RNA-binding protein [Thermoanaerobaculia bacterium]